MRARVRIRAVRDIAVSGPEESDRAWNSSPTWRAATSAWSSSWTTSRAQLPPERSRALEIHLDLCPSCVCFVNTYRDTVNIARTLQAEDIPPELTQRLIDFLRKEKEAPHRRPD